MKSVEKYVNHIKEEVNDAMDYAEKYVIFKATRPQFARMYHEMAENELTHAEYLRQIGQAMMEEYAYKPNEDVDNWNSCVKMMAEQTAIVRLMLSK